MSVYSDKTSVSRAMHNLSRGRGRVIIPAWEKGDRVLHKPSGLCGRLTERATAAGELWKMLVDCDCGGGAAAEALGLCKKQRRAVTVHACDLELRT